MAAEVYGTGPVSMSARQATDGHRTYTVVWRVRVDDTLNGPAEALQAAGLPAPGAALAIGTSVDAYAYCTWEADVEPDQANSSGDAVRFYLVTQTFTTKPPSSAGGDGGGGQRPNDATRPENPLLEPAKIKKGFAKYKEHATYDRFGLPVCTSSWEQILGPQNEWDVSDPVVEIEQNVATDNFGTIANYMDCVNGTTLWGVPPGGVKLMDGDIERRFYGSSSVYYVRKLKFQVRYRLVYIPVPDAPGTFTTTYVTWDRDLLDEGTKVLNGHWEGERWILDPVDYVYDEDGLPVPTAGTGSGTGADFFDFETRQPDPLRPDDFIRYTDKQGNIARVVLDGRGRPYQPGVTDDEIYYWWMEGGSGGEHVYLGTYDQANAQATAEGAALYGIWEDIDDAQADGDNGRIGAPWTQNPRSLPGKIHVERYTRVNLLALGIPSSV